MRSNVLIIEQRILNVTQSHLSRMEYMSVKPINGHEVSHLKK